MARHRYVNTRFWDDTYILSLKPSERFLFIYLLTNSNTNIAGIYEISTKKMSLELGYDEEKILKMLTKLQKDKKIYFIEHHIIIKNFIHYQLMSPKIRKGIITILNSLNEKMSSKICVKQDGLYLKFDKNSEIMLSNRINTVLLKEQQLYDEQMKNKYQYNRLKNEKF